MVYSTTLKTEELLKKIPHARGYLVAFSGGADSTALLHLLKDQVNLRAIHINHGIQLEANSWQNHCQQLCDQLSIPLIVEQAQLPDHSENTCRQARYDFFAKHLLNGEVLLTAHHADDQAETVLLKLMRGTGLKGLGGIEHSRSFASGHIIRPLLEYRSEQLKHYLVQHQLCWIEDHSNQDRRYKRNMIRHEITPVLQQHNPQAINNIVRSADNCRQTLDLLHHLCDFDQNTLAIAQLKKLPERLQASLVYQWLSHKNIPTPDKKTLQQISHDFIHAKKDRHPHHKNQFYQLNRYQQAIHCIKNFTAIDSTVKYCWQTTDDFELPNGCGVLSYTGNKPLELIIRFGQTGHKLTSHQHQFNKTVKQLFQDHNIPIWVKQNTPFIFDGNTLVSLGHSWSHTQPFKNSLHLHLIDFNYHN